MPIGGSYACVEQGDYLPGFAGHPQSPKFQAISLLAWTKLSGCASIGHRSPSALRYLESSAAFRHRYAVVGIRAVPLPKTWSRLMIPTSTRPEQTPAEPLHDWLDYAYPLSSSRTPGGMEPATWISNCIAVISHLPIADRRSVYRQPSRRNPPNPNPPYPVVLSVSTGRTAIRFDLQSTLDCCSPARRPGTSDPVPVVPLPDRCMGISAICRYRPNPLSVSNTLMVVVTDDDVSSAGFDGNPAPVLVVVGSLIYWTWPAASDASLSSWLFQNHPGRTIGRHRRPGTGRAPRVR